ncbi:MAG: response regulator [Elusimicrobiales bacterium]|nr:response regulator [Elusimicrobiales bacterium]
MSGSIRRLNILLVDDSDDDALMARTTLEHLGLPHKIKTFCDGRQALDYLRCAGKYADRKPALPDLLLVDINMPLMDGLSFLRAIKEDAALKKLPVIMLTSSTAREDITRSFEAGAASYLAKPNNFEGYKKLLHSFGNYWLTVSALPE